MTVLELIQKLEQYPQNLEVEIHVDDKFYNGSVQYVTKRDKYIILSAEELLE